MAQNRIYYADDVNMCQALILIDHITQGPCFFPSFLADGSLVNARTRVLRQMINAKLAMVFFNLEMNHYNQ